MLRVWDISEFQTITNWLTLTSAFPVGIARAYNGYRVDHKFVANQAQMRKLCAVRGYYLYLVKDRDPATQVHEFQATTGPLFVDEFLIIDHEEGSGNQVPRLEAAIAALTDPHEWVYSGLAFSRAHLAGEKIDWIAAYQKSEPTAAHEMWQNQDNYKFPGIAAPSDASVFNGSVQDLINLIGWGPTPTPVTGVKDMPYIARDTSSVAQWLIEGNTRAHIPDVPTLSRQLARFGASIPYSPAMLNAIPIAGTKTPLALQRQHKQFVEELRGLDNESLAKLGYTKEDIKNG